MPTKRELKRRLRQIRGEKQQQQISAEVGVHPSIWSRAERHGIIGPGLKLALIRSLGIDLDEPPQPTP